jgi:hypothetical protein
VDARTRRGPASYVNSGLLEKTGGSGVSSLALNILNSGTIEGSSGAIDFQDALWGAGTTEVSNGATIEVDGAVATRQTLGFDGAGVIAFDDLDVAGLDMFHGRISSFGTGDSLDIGAPFGAGTIRKFTPSADHTYGFLTLINGSLSASIEFIGDYSTASFAPTLSAPAAGQTRRDARD